MYSRCVVEDGKLEKYVFSILALLYLVSRPILLVEIFVGLRALPRNAYQTVRWSDCLPSFG